MGDVKRKTPNTMPTDKAVVKASQALTVPMLMAGSRGNQRTGKLIVSTPSLAQVSWQI